MRARPSLPFSLAVGAAVLAAGVVTAGSIPRPEGMAATAAGGLLVGEVMTGGVSASDEYVELYNAGAAPADLGGLELVYVTASGGTITRKAAWSAGTLLEPGRHLLVANTLGTFAAIGDATYSGGLAATGGALVLRPTGGSPIDAAGWGNATNSFVEGAPAAAPAAGASIERRPGGLGGNGDDSNANDRDFFVNTAPVPQNLSAPPVPAPQPTETPAPTPTASPEPTPTSTPESSATPTVEPTAEPTPGVTPEPTPEPTAGPTPTAEPTSTPLPSLDPTPSPEPSPTAEPTQVATPSPEPSPTAEPTPPATPSPAPTLTLEPTPGSTPTPSEPAPTPSETASPTPAATPTPAPTPGPDLRSIADARATPDGSAVTVQGILTTPLGLTDEGRGAFVQDASAGIALYLAGADWTVVPAGTVVRVSGTVDDRYAQRTVRLAAATDLIALASETPLEGHPVATGGATEALEGVLITVEGLVVAGPDALSDGFAFTVDDGSGPLRVVAVVASGVVPASVEHGARYRISGPLGQRDSSGTGVQGYRIYVRSTADVVRLPDPPPPPSPTPTPSPTPPPSTSLPPSPTPIPTPPPSPSSDPSPTPTPQPTPDPEPVIPIGEARWLPLDQVVTIEGVVTAEPGRIVDERTMVIQDDSGGIAVRLLGSQSASLARGAQVVVTGEIGQRYGNLELRVDADDPWSMLGPGVLPAARRIVSAEMGEGVEGQLVRIVGRVLSLERSGGTGNFAATLEDGSGRARVFVFASTGVAEASFARGATIEVTGVAGQRAPTRGATTGYRIWPRDPADVRLLLPAGDADASGPAGGAVLASGPSAALSIVEARGRAGETVTLSGVVTVPPGLLDTDGRRLVLEDGTAAIIVRLPSGSAGLEAGLRLVVTGRVGTYYGSPQVEPAEQPEVVDRPGELTPQAVRRAPVGAGLAWRLVRVSGRVTVVHRFGATWRAELLLPGGQVLVYGSARAGVLSTTLVAGRAATVTGFVRPPYTSASDRRYAIAPRSREDVRLEGSSAGASGGPALAPGTRPRAEAADRRTDGADPAARSAGVAEGPLDVELGELTGLEGRLVRVGGLVVLVEGRRVTLDDGLAQGTVLLPIGAETVARDLRLGEALNAVGRVVRDGDGVAVAPGEAGDLARVGGLGELTTVAAAPDPSPAAAPVRGEARLAFPGPGSADPATLLPVGIATLAATLCTIGARGALRWRRARRLEARVQARLLAFGGPWSLGGEALPDLRAAVVIEPGGPPRAWPGASAVLDAGTKGRLSSAQLRTREERSERSEACRTGITALHSRSANVSTTSHSAPANWPSTSSSPGTPTGSP